MVELEGNLRGCEPPPQALRRQNLKMNRIVRCILPPPPRVGTLCRPAVRGCRVGVSKPHGQVGHFPAQRRKDCLPGKSRPTSWGPIATWLG